MSALNALKQLLSDCHYCFFHRHKAIIVLVWTPALEGEALERRSPSPLSCGKSKTLLLALGKLSMNCDCPAYCVLSWLQAFFFGCSK